MTTFLASKKGVLCIQRLLSVNVNGNEVVGENGNGRMGMGKKPQEWE